MGIQQPVEGFGPFRQFGEIAILQRFRERIEQAPHVSTLKRIMPWLAPLLQHWWDEAVTAYADVRGPDDKVMGFDVSDLGLFIGFDAFVLIVPFCQE